MYIVSGNETCILWDSIWDDNIILLGIHNNIIMTGKLWWCMLFMQLLWVQTYWLNKPESNSQLDLEKQLILWYIYSRDMMHSHWWNIRISTLPIWQTNTTALAMMKARGTAGGHCRCGNGYIISSTGYTQLFKATKLIKHWKAECGLVMRLVLAVCWLLYPSILEHIIIHVYMYGLCLHVGTLYLSIISTFPHYPFLLLYRPLLSASAGADSQD